MHTHFVGSVVSRLKFCYTVKDLYLNVFKALVEGNQGRFTRTVGQENYYLQYEVRVTAFNEFGEGPTSPPGVYIYSAEDCEFSMFIKREPVLYGWKSRGGVHRFLLLFGVYYCSVHGVQHMVFWGIFRQEIVIPKNLFS